MINKKIAIIGLGYVGLPLAVEFSKKHKVVGYDINYDRVKQLNKGVDCTLEVESKDLLDVLKSEEVNKGITFTDKIDDIKNCNIYIITVPTPVDENNRPLLDPLISASRMVGKVLKINNIVIYESTVYPGATEEECVPVLENSSGLKFNQDFYCGYSPERINPGDKLHTVTKIKKVTSGSTIEIGQIIDELYRGIITAGTHLAPTIKVAEAAKVIENAQRDINIAFVNELSKIFNILNIDTNDVLEAASTKWNFLPFKPGLVGGHCIGVDPYYLAQKAQQVGYHPEIILSGRRMNDSMGEYISTEVLKSMIKKGISIKGSQILMLGITFKENCPDIRNTKVIDVYKTLISYGMHIDVYDPWANSKEVEKEYNLTLLDEIKDKKYDSIIHAVSHNEFKQLDFEKLKKSSSVVFDVKGTLDKKIIDKRL
ncbi:nucleotide sugar dehydrogenase [Galbibacter sp. BG1]